MRSFRYIITALTLALIFILPAQLAGGGYRLTLRSVQHPQIAAASPVLSGVIKDGSTGMPLQGALVSLVGENNSTLSVLDGSFELPVQAPGSHKIRVGISGYLPKDIDYPIGQTAPVSYEILLYPGDSYTFTLEIAFEKKTSDSYGDPFAKTWEAIDEINRKFNTGELKAYYNFQPRYFSVFNDSDAANDGAYYNCTHKLHVGTDYYIAIDRYASQQGGYFATPYFNILHAWQDNANDKQNGPFSEFATDALVHELGHARGAIDLYALEADTNNNPIAPGIGFKLSEASFMNYPYGVERWGDYSAAIINMQGGAQAIADSGLIDHSRPGKIMLKLVDKDGIPLPAANVIAYPVLNYSNQVSHESIYAGKSNAEGVMEVPSDLVGFNFLSDKNILNIFLLLDFKGQRFYSWLPVTELNKAYWGGQTLVYTKRIIAPFGCADDSPPEIFITEPRPSQILHSRNVEIKGNARDDVGVDPSSLTVNLDGIKQLSKLTFSEGMFSCVIEVSSSGLHRVEVMGEDFSHHKSSALVDFDILFDTGDVNGDTKVDIFDLVFVAKIFGENEGSLQYNVRADVIKDGYINILDLVAVAVRMN